MNRIITFALMLSVTATVALAQPQPRPKIPRPGTPEFLEWELLRRQQQQGPPKDWTVKGKIHSFNVRGGEVNVLSEDNQQWRVKFGNDAQVSVKGKGGAQFLQPRAAVRFYAPITKKKLIAEPVARVTTFSPRDPFKPMLEAKTEEEARAEMAEEEAAETGAEVAPIEEEVEPSIEEEEFDPPTLQDRVNREPERTERGRPNRGRDAKADDEGPPEWFLVQGILLSVKKGKFIVDAGEGGRIRGELAEDVKVDADLQGIQFARPGDSIEAKGKTSQPGFAMAVSADVTLVAQPLTSEDGPRRNSRNRGRRADRGDESDVDAESEEPRATRPRRSTR